MKNNEKKYTHIVKKPSLLIIWFVILTFDTGIGKYFFLSTSSSVSDTFALSL